MNLTTYHNLPLEEFQAQCSLVFRRMCLLYHQDEDLPKKRRLRNNYFILQEEKTADLKALLKGGELTLHIP